MLKVVKSMRISYLSCIRNIKTVMVSFGASLASASCSSYILGLSENVQVPHPLDLGSGTRLVPADQHSGQKCWRPEGGSCAGV